MAIKKISRASGEISVEQTVNVAGRVVRLEAEDPQRPGEKLVHTITFGEDGGAVNAELLALDDAAFAAKVQELVDKAAQRLATEVESRRRVAAALAQVK
jgi:hypothetical protein